jgi:adenylate cyclase class 2
MVAGPIDGGMYEVEVKVRADHGRVRGALEDADAAFVGRVLQEDTYFGAPDRSFSETDEALRIRRERSDGEETARLTYKGPLVESESKTREEFETGVDDGETMGHVLERLGYYPVATVRKERDRYAFGDYEVHLDAVDDLGEFVEVETEASDSSYEADRAGAYEILERLGLDPDTQIRTSYLELILESATGE